MKKLALGSSILSLLLASDAVAPLGKYTPAERRHWAFVARAQPQIPTFALAAGRAWAHNPIDAFILARMQKEGLRPAPQASRETLIRRVYFDLTGLPPTPQAVARFAADNSSGAYAALVEQLLNSPHYGERWGQHWLDVVRFAETDGFEYDTLRKEAWRYRDYVIRAFQNDKPYDRFLTEQLAGDEIAPKEDETLIAAGFNRLGPFRKNAGNQDIADSRNEVLTEMTNVVGSALLGVTLGCARCHDHKFDPIRQSDYYRIEAYFAAAQTADIPRSTAEEQAAWKAQVAPMQDHIKEYARKVKTATADEAGVLLGKIQDIQENLPPPPPSLYSMSDDMEHKTSIHLLARGNYQNKGGEVGMRPLGVLLPDGAPEVPNDTRQPRAALAKWIDPDNPLTARVMVNRIWQYHFGRGIVATPNDFGRMGERPTHPELLDYLANEFVSSGFSVKHMHRLILLSSAYRQSSAASNDTAEEKDPDNRLLWKFNRRRLEAAEEIRDAMLAVSGALNEKQGGPSVIVPADPSVVSALQKPAQWIVTKDAAEHNRRSVYLISKRNLHLPFMEVFDAPDTLTSCPRRESSTHAPQALELLNGDLANRQAELLAKRLETEAGRDTRKKVDLAYRLVAGRSPSPGQMKRSVAFLKTQSQREFALAMLNLNAFLYVD